RAAEHAAPEEIARLRQLALELAAARQRGDVAADIAKLTAFQFALYRAAHMPLLLPVIETLWLQTGSCLRLLYPDYIRALKHDWRGQIIRALQAGDGDAARRAIESDIGPALAYIADLAGEDGIIQPHSARSGPRKASLAEAAARAENA
ncbi:MAG TPA: FCD domain-containing protein, partial [Kiloniellaceae bacterium]